GFNVILPHFHMMYFLALFGLVIALCITGNIVLFVFSGLRNGLTKFFENIPETFQSNNVNVRYNKYEIYLQNKFKYYDKLSLAQQRKFLQRIGSFIRSKEFVGKKE